MRHRIQGKLASAAAVAVTTLWLAAGAGAADGVPRPDDRATHGPGAIVLEQSLGVARPDDRATHGPGAIAEEQLLVAQPTASSPFQWADAGIGALSMLGMVLVVAGCSVVAFRRRPEPA